MIAIMLEEQGRVPIAADRDKIVDRFMKEEQLSDATLVVGEFVKTLLSIGRFFASRPTDDYRVIFIKTSQDQIIVLGAEQLKVFDAQIKSTIETQLDRDSHTVVLEILLSKG